MKLIRLAMISVLMIAALSIAGCFPPIIPIDDPDDPVIPVLTIPVAAFSYYCIPPIQTDSVVMFDGSASYDPDDEIMWGKWDFDDGNVEEGIWTKTIQVWKNGEWVWEAVSRWREINHTFDTTGLYTVMLTVWDYDDNQSSTTRDIRVR